MEDDTEYVVTAIINVEPAVIINNKIREETRNDVTLEKLKEAIQKEDWEMKKKDPEIRLSCLRQTVHRR